MDSEKQLTPYGAMSASLNEGRLADLCLTDGVQTGPFGSQLHQEDYVQDGTPIITVEHLGENRIVHQDLPCVSDEDRQRLNKYSLQTGDIVFSRVGSVDRRAIVRETENGWLFSGRCLRVRADPEKLDAQWLSYFFGLPSFRQYIRGIAVGATMPSINTKILSDVPIYFPDIDQQRKAAKLLASLDDKIDLNRRINQTLETMAQAIFKSWFVDFDPVKAKIAALAEGRDSLRAAMSVISGKAEAELDALPPEHYAPLAATAALFPDEMEESALGEIPRGWSASPFGSLLTHTIGGDWGAEVPDSVNDTRVAIIRGTDLPDLDQAQSPRVPIRYTTRKKLASRQLLVGDIVLEVSGGSKDQPTGRSIRITANTMREFDCPLEPASFCRLLRPACAEIGVILGLHLTHIYALGKTWEYQNQSTGIANFQTSHFLEAELVVNPSARIAEKFYELVNPLLERRHDAQCRRLADLRDSLLPKLLSGELSISTAIAEVEA